MKYIPALDGIRAIAVFLVIMYHCETPGFWGGYVGVDIFFVLSGYLITTLLMEELQRKNRIALIHFYLRRLFRLMPPMIILSVSFIILGYFVWPQEMHAILKDIALTLLYLSDYSQAFWRVPLVLTHSWSLSVEEHYYVLWPLILMLVHKYSSRPFIKKLGGAAGVYFLLYILATLWRIHGLQFYDGSWKDGYFRFDMHCSGLLLGSSLAAFRVNGGKISGSYGFLFFSMALCAFFSFLSMVDLKSAICFAIFFAELLGLATILLCLDPEENRVSKFLAMKPLAYLGRISYGLYLYHFLIYNYFLLIYKLEWLKMSLVVLPLALTVAVISYHLVEKPIVLWSQKRFGHLKR